MVSFSHNRFSWTQRLKYILFISVSLIFIYGEACAEDTYKKASLIPQWVPQAQFAGYYLALEKGIYERYGMELTIHTGGPGRPSSDFLKDHKADFATLWLSSALQMRDQGVKVVNIAQMLQRSALMLVAKKDRGILRPEDLDGKKVGLWDPVFQIQPKAFFKKYHLNVKTVHQSYSVNLFLRDGVDAASAMWYNEYHTILNAGIDPDELTTFFFNEHDLNFPEDGIYALEDTLERDPDLCKAFVRASIEGWMYAFAHPEEALDIVMKNLKKEHIPATRVHQRWMLSRMRDLMIPEDVRIVVGKLVPEDFNRVAKGLKENGLINSIPDINIFYKQVYVP
jgi:NitT/TauT family transport system substrate-binding protein